MRKKISALANPSANQNTRRATMPISAKHQKTESENPIGL